MSRRTTVLGTAAFVVLGAVGSAPAQVLYTNNFDVNSTANWTVNAGPSDHLADFFFDYSTAGVPAAPNSGGTTRGLKLGANYTNGIFSGVSVSPNGQSFAGDYTLRFDWWSNFNGPAPVGGSGSTQMTTYGIDTSGTVAQWPGGTQDSIWFAATGDGNSSSDWRAYSPTAATRYVDSSGVYAAGTQAGSTNASDPYYASFGSVSAPAAQTALFPQQTGTTLVGSAAFEWHDVVISKVGGNVTWTVDGTLIATVPVADDTVLTGNNIFFGHSDTNATSSTDPNDMNLLFSLIDNVSVTVVPEPTSLALAGVGALGLLRRRRR
jgi:MYXO-CTERM domain-containing protein